jgi:hypothetical protein
MTFYCLINQANDYLQSHLGSGGRPFTTPRLHKARFWASRQVIDSMCELTNKDWNTTFRVLRFEIEESK